MCHNHIQNSICLCSRLHSYNTNFERSGYYMMESNSPDVPNLVYCNLTKRLFDPNIEMNYGRIKREGVWFKLVKNNMTKDDIDASNLYTNNRRYSRRQTVQQIKFSSVETNTKNAIGDIELVAPVTSWFQFHTKGVIKGSYNLLKLKTIRHNGETKQETLNPDDSYKKNQTTFKLFEFSKYLEKGDKVQLWGYGYNFSIHQPFTFEGYSVP